MSHNDLLQQAWEHGRTQGLGLGRLQGAIGMAVIIIALYALSAWLGGSIL